MMDPTMMQQMQQQYWQNLMAMQNYGPMMPNMTMDMSSMMMMGQNASTTDFSAATAMQMPGMPDQQQQQQQQQG